MFQLDHVEVHPDSNRAGSGWRIVAEVDARGEATESAELDTVPEMPEAEIELPRGVSVDQYSRVEPIAVIPATRIVRGVQAVIPWRQMRRVVKVVHRGAPTRDTRQQVG